MSTEVSDNPPAILLSHTLKTLKLPTFQREYQKLARLCATQGVDHVGYLTQLAEQEMIERDPQVDRELVWLLDDWRLTGNADIVPDFGAGMDMAMAGRIGNLVTLNGTLPWFLTHATDSACFIVSRTG